ncbi:MAG: hypothetical protein GY708_12645 [Actinomycetia bacterium]|nr:hypothetical protein [Actinomycetes bacterium]MCP4957742.1 hypothetical protein [Actinomycetes bacterium]
MTGIVQTLVDMASEAPERSGQLMDEAGRKQLLSVDALRRRCDKGGRGVAGFGEFRRQVEMRVDWLGKTESQLENRFAEILARAGLPLPVAQFWIVDGDGNHHRLDWAYPQSRTAIELDGYRFHSDPTAFSKDRATQNALNEMGWTTYRYSWPQLDQRPDVVVRQMLDAAPG